MYSREPAAKALLRASWQTLQSDLSLLLLPILAAVFSVVVTVALVLLGLSLSGAAVLAGGGESASDQLNVSPLWLAVGVLIAYFTTVIAVFFQVALAAGAMDRLDGGDPTVRSCIAKAATRLPQVLLWSAITTTVGMLLRAISDRTGIGAVLSIVGAVAWAVMTFFVVPLIVVEGLGGWAAASRSKDLIAQRWGQVARSGLRFGFLFTIPALAMGGLTVAGILIAPSTAILGLSMAAAGLLGILVIALLSNATMTYLRTVLYRYAVGLPVPGVDTATLAGAIGTRA